MNVRGSTNRLSPFMLALQLHSLLQFIIIGSISISVSAGPMWMVVFVFLISLSTRLARKGLSRARLRYFVLYIGVYRISKPLLFHYITLPL